MIEKILDLFFRREDINREQDNVIYMKRWFLLRLYGHRLCIHKMLRPDYDKCKHDHPWPFTTFILYGGYKEELLNGDIVYNKVFRLYNREAKYAHRIAELPKGVCWTIVHMKKKIKKWGFFTNQGFKTHEDFLSKPHMSADWCNFKNE